MSYLYNQNFTFKFLTCFWILLTSGHFFLSSNLFYISLVEHRYYKSHFQNNLFYAAFERKIKDVYLVCLNIKELKCTFQTEHAFGC